LRMNSQVLVQPGRGGFLGANHEKIGEHGRLFNDLLFILEIAGVKHSFSDVAVVQRR
jgi:hypothetical protein